MMRFVRTSHPTVVFSFLLLVSMGMVVPRPLAMAPVTVGDRVFSPARLRFPQGTRVIWSFSGPAAHTVTDRSGMGLFDSGQASSGSFQFTFVAAASYPYSCSVHSDMVGTVRIPIKVSPAQGSSDTSFTITWSSAVAPAGFVFDVQLKRPGAIRYTNWKRDQTAGSATFEPDNGAGAYTFRARLRKPSVKAFAGWSPARTITVR
jgi:hypothetical protein